MLTNYIHAAMKHATYGILPDGEGFFGEIPSTPGVWSNADTLESCREELREVLEEWILIRVRQGLDLPIIDQIDLNDHPLREEVA